MPRTNPQGSHATDRVNTAVPVRDSLREACVSLREDLVKGDPVPRHGYPLPEELARHAPNERPDPDELRTACRSAGEGLGAEDAREARFRSAAEMIGLWRGLDLPAWISPYALRDARLGYLNGYGQTLVSGELSRNETHRAARARWGERWKQKLEAARRRTGDTP